MLGKVDNGVSFEGVREAENGLRVEISPIVHRYRRRYRPPKWRKREIGLKYLQPIELEIGKIYDQT